VELFASGQHSSKEFAELFGVTRSTVYRAVARNNTPSTAWPATADRRRQPPPLTPRPAAAEPSQ
jgi:transposase